LQYVSDSHASPTGSSHPLDIPNRPYRPRHPSSATTDTTTNPTISKPVQPVT